MSKILWAVDVSYYHRDEVYNMSVSGLTSAPDGSDVEVTVYEEYDRKPCEMDAQYHRDEVKEILAEAGLYSGGNDD